MANVVEQGDCLDIMRNMADRSVALTFCSPPYEDARMYSSLGFKLKGQAWVDWAVERFVECLRVTDGLVAWVVEGRTRSFRWSATPTLLMADLHRKGIHLRKPPIYSRVGIPGSGGPDWLRNDYEFIVCATNGGKLPWSDNVSMGRPPKFRLGGDMTHCTRRGRVGKTTDFSKRFGSSPHKHGARNICKIANPGNVIRCLAGGGHFGSRLAHENEAPFPEKLAEFFIRSFCPPNGIVLDPFCGSGTTLAVASRLDRQYHGIDLRQEQVDLSNRRLAEVQREFFV